MKKLIDLIRDKRKLFVIIFGSDTKEGKIFDIIVMIAISLSMVAAFVESIPSLHEEWKLALTILEYVLTSFFTIEYVLRVYCVPKKRNYVFSFFGIIDLVSTLPSYLSFFFPVARYFFIIRSFRLIRVFRVLRLFAFINEGQILLQSIMLSMKKILVYFLFVLILVTIIGTLMYMVEGTMPDSSFVDIPTSIYWAIVTLTTVGYGDITPVTGFGKFLSSLVMILGYAIIAIPTGIVSATMIDEKKKGKAKHTRCPRCNRKADSQSNYCKYCGEKL